MAYRNIRIVNSVTTQETTTTVTLPSYTLFDIQRGAKRYELTNHLGNVLAVVSDKKIQVCTSTAISYYTADLVSATDYSPFGAPLAGRSYTAPNNSYRFAFNGKENDNETQTQDYGMRIYDYRLGKFLSVDPLTKSYPNYSSYQFAGNKPIIAIDLEGLEEKIVIYSISNGKTVTTTINYRTLTETTEMTGKYAHHKKISKEEFEKYKVAFFEAFADLKGSFTNGYEQYTLGMSAQNKAGYRGMYKGTLTIAAVTDNISLSYDPTPLQEKKESSAAIIKRNLENPDAQTKAAINTMKNYVAGVSLAVSLPSLATTAPTWGMIPEYSGAISNADQLTGGNLTSTGNPTADKTINVIKVVMDVWSIGNSYNALFDMSKKASTVTDAVPSLLSGSAGTTLDATDVIIPPKPQQKN
jgi:RHS repeat-associated protein